MTTIAFRDGVLAADSMAYGGNYCASPGEKWKIWRLADGSLLGVSSTLVGAGEALRDLLDGAAVIAKDDLPEEYHALRVTADGFYVSKGAGRWSGPIEAPYVAIGSGADFALGAMAMGASAIEAVSAAIKHDQHTGGAVRFLDFA